jgi:hypothetical protein
MLVAVQGDERPGTGVQIQFAIRKLQLLLARRRGVTLLSRRSDAKQHDETRRSHCNLGHESLLLSLDTEREGRKAASVERLCAVRLRPATPIEAEL